MARFTAKSSREVESLLKHHGFVLVEKKRGSHALWASPDDLDNPVFVPMNKKSIPRGTLKGILDVAGISRNEAVKFWSGQTAQ